MKHLKLSTLLLAGIVAFFGGFTSCKKEQGCVDSSATNYSVDAEEDDGSCTFPAPTTTENLPGVAWTMTYAETDGGETSSATGTVTFKADGTGNMSLDGNADPLTWSARETTITIDADVWTIDTNETSKQVFTLSFTSEGRSIVRTITLTR